MFTRTGIDTAALRYKAMTGLVAAALIWTANAAPAPVAPASGTASPPLVVDADRSTAVSAPGSDTGQATYAGHVVITRGVTVIHGEHAVVYTHAQAVTRAVVTGNPATFLWRDRQGRPVHGRARQITYEAKGDSVELSRDVVVTRGTQRFSAAEATYYLKTQTLNAHGTSAQRVHAVFPPSAATAGGT